MQTTFFKKFYFYYIDVLVQKRNEKLFEMKQKLFRILCQIVQIRFQSNF